VFSLLFVWPHMNLCVSLLCVDVCVVLVLAAVGVFCRAPTLPCPDFERRCCAEIKLKNMFEMLFEMLHVRRCACALYGSLESVCVGFVWTRARQL
jgi:hypothetical protein